MYFMLLCALLINLTINLKIRYVTVFLHQPPNLHLVAKVIQANKPRRILAVPKTIRSNITPIVDILYNWAGMVNSIIMIINSSNKKMSKGILSMAFGTIVSMPFLRPALHIRKINRIIAEIIDIIVMRIRV